MTQRSVHAVRQEPEDVGDVALSRSVRAGERRERTELELDFPNAAVVPDIEPSDHCVRAACPSEAYPNARKEASRRARRCSTRITTARRCSSPLPHLSMI